MKASIFAHLLLDPKSKSCFWSIFIASSLIGGAYFIGSEFLSQDYRILPAWKLNYSRKDTRSEGCKKDQCRPVGSEALPEGIISKTSDFHMRPLWGPVAANKYSKPSASLLAIAVGIKQKEIVNRIVEKFLENDFVVMLFHYDGMVDEWRDFGWNDHVIHVSAMNQTKWWFAKRFLHPDIVAEYDYIFLWDEDLGVNYFHPGRYVTIIKEEGLEISQPALERFKSDVHHPITMRRKNLKVHRRFYKLKGSGRCYNNSTSPPCIGWVEMMAPVFSRAAWRCVWYMIQNDLIHAWGLDMQLGYCAQGDRTRNVGVVDSEYILHLDIRTLGVTVGDRLSYRTLNRSSQAKNSSDLNAMEASNLLSIDNRTEVRRQSFNEMQIFKKRWMNAVKKDKCWVDPYRPLVNQTSH